jgi:hypothetical protein
MKGLGRHILEARLVSIPALLIMLAAWAGDRNDYGEEGRYDGARYDRR